MFVKHRDIGKRLMSDVRLKKIKLRPYFMKYLNLRRISIHIYNTQKQIMNVNRLEKKLKHKSIEEAMHHLRDMLEPFNIKFKERFVNNLDLVDNMVRLCSKLLEKEFNFTSKLVYNTIHKSKDDGLEAA
eukprot:TRINITY_DN11439_c0_g1_i6.p2 TRINITY_DN11439_c0_g1~~TRINITY_DN11439_c0_g1_i6.p2  ORF type:complete len:129 (-),score=46.69 TRINITY_DN11439_c0_g1_i6:215-601(-)